MNHSLLVNVSVTVTLINPILKFAWILDNIYKQAVTACSSEQSLDSVSCRCWTCWKMHVQALLLMLTPENLPLSPETSA